MSEEFKEYILFRDDIEAPKDIITIQISKDIVEILGGALEEKGILKTSSEWFWNHTNVPERGHRQISLLEILKGKVP